MMRNIEQLATFKALERSRQSRNLGFLDHLLRQDGAVENLVLKRIQFETHPGLVDHLDDICRTLDVSRREFLEAAVTDAVTTAQAQFDGVYLQSTGRPYGEEA
mgnify:CR=1 FL=1|jgi:hypothetical protein